MIGQTISHYRILEKLGEGGMGVVYKAEDTRLRRTVALKFLPKEAIEDRERFHREAQAAAALNHSMICTVYEIDEGHGFLAIEFIDGSTIKDKIAARPLPLEEALDIAQQACAGLQAAHGKGIVHRDIKPANLMLTAQRQVKIMDFGIAQLGGRTRITKTGASLGTPAYMSPEQARGETADARSDIWSLGVVLYEMLTGRLPFDGERDESVLLAILNREPEPLTARRAGLPMELERIVGKALAKDPANRYQHVEDMLVDLRALAGKPVPFVAAPPRPALWRMIAPWALAAILAAAAAFAWFPTRTGPASPVARLTIPIPADRDLVPTIGLPFDVSPDGTKLVYAATSDGVTQLFIRSFDEFDTRPLAGTSGARELVFSPDGRSLAFVANEKLLRLSLAGGAAVALCDVKEEVRGMSWAGDTILYGTESGLWSVSAAGGVPHSILKGPAFWPAHLPGGQSALVTVGARNISVVALDTGKSRTLLPGKQGTYLPTGHLVYASAGGVRAVRFDAAAQRIDGGSISALDDVYDGQNGGATYFRVTAAGTLLYVPGRNEHSLVHVGRNGLLTPLAGRRGGFRLPRVSPDGRRIALVIDPPDEGPSDIWILDTANGGLTRFTAREHNLSPVWTPDGQRLVWARQGTVATQAADGSGKPATLVARYRSQFKYPRSITPDGRTLIYDQVEDRMFDIWAAPLEGGGQPYPIVNSAFYEGQAQLSPNGRWLAYVSDESGAREVYVQRFPAQGSKSLISPRGGRSPFWSRDGKELFYIEGDRMMAALVAAGQGFSAGQPHPLFERKDITVGNAAFGVTDDGFVMVRRDPLSMLTEFRVVFNWFDELKRLAP